MLSNSKVNMVYRIKHTIIDRIYSVLAMKVSRSDKMWLREVAIDCN